jgi:RNA polymerase sigma-70 factor (ECF subfamily)
LISWLRQILAGLLANLVRRYFGTQRRDVRLERELADELDRSSRALGQSLAAPHSTPSQQAARREQTVLLADALDLLPEDYREVIILHHLEGLGFAEIADRMGRSIDSVKNLWARALAQLRRSLGAVDARD